MGFKKHTERPRGVYVKVAKGHLCVPCEEDDDGAVEHEYNGVISYEQHYDAFEGHLEKAYIKESSKYADQLILEVRDRTAKHTINIALGYDSSYAMKFYKCMKNLDLAQPIEFCPYHFVAKDTGKTKQGWNFKQNNEKVEDAFSKDEIPEWIEKLEHVKGKSKPVKTFDYSDAMAFFLRHFKKWQTKNNLLPVEGDKDEDDAPVKKKRAVVEDDDEPAPRKKKPVVEDDDDDEPPPPKKKRPVVEDDDDDDDTPPPPKKKRPVVEDDDDDEPAPVKKKRPVVEDDDDDDEPVAKKR